MNDSIDSRNTWIPSIPQIATWRLQNSFGGSNSYVLHSITNDSQATVTITEANVYEYTPSEPISVQAGDIVSIMMPPNDDKRTKSVRPLFLRLYKGNSSTVSCTRLGNSQHFFLADGMCLNQLQQQFLYIPLLTAITNEIVATIYSTYSTMAPSPSLGPTPTIINVAPTVTMAHTVSTVRPAQGKDTSSTTSELALLIVD